METFKVWSLDGFRGLALAGELDMASARVLREAFETLPGTGPATLDLAELTFIDSSGLHEIVRSDPGRRSSDDDAGVRDHRRGGASEHRDQDCEQWRLTWWSRSLSG